MDSPVFPDSPWCLFCGCFTALITQSLSICELPLVPFVWTESLSMELQKFIHNRMLLLVALFHEIFV